MRHSAVFTSTTSGVYSFTAASDSTGSYTCTITNPVGSDTSSVNVFVGIPPTVSPQCPPVCDTTFCRPKSARRMLCTVPPEKVSNSSCSPECNVAFCINCYFSATQRELPEDCTPCRFNPGVGDERERCYRRWATCVRRRLGKVRWRDGTDETFQCFQHQCV